MFGNRKQIGYVSGLRLYNSLGLTSQVSGVIEIASTEKKRSLKFAGLRIHYKIGERFFSGKENDLSEFGCDIYKWQELELRVENKFAKLLLNGKSIADLTYNEEFGKLVGIIYTFGGTGSVDYVQLSDTNGNIVYNDQFD